MALAITTVTSPVAVIDTSIVVASATGMAIGNRVVMDNEVMQVGKGYAGGLTIPVLRGQDGSATAAHVNGVSVFNGIGALDFAPVPPGDTVAQPSAFAQSITPLGTTNLDAAQVSTNVPSVVLANGAAGAGINLPLAAAQPGAVIVLKNLGAGALKVYCNGGLINAIVGTTGISIAAGLGGMLVCCSCGIWQTVPVPA